jgi:hypothetical protein
MAVLDRIPDWKDFERLCADLLEAERFVVTNEPSVDTSGRDLEAIEEYTSHDPSRSVLIRWRVQCKHYAQSGRRLDRAEMEAILVSFDAVRRPYDGLLVMISTDYTEPARRVWDEYVGNHQNVRIQVWNGRQIEAKLERYPNVARRYGITPTHEPNPLSPFEELRILGPRNIFIISDQSPLAHDVVEGCSLAGFNVSLLPVWNYLELSRLKILLDAIVESPPHLVVLFLGDTFGYPLPTALSEVVRSAQRRGGSLLLFPFLAWLVARGQSGDLESLCPVALIPAGGHGRSPSDERQMIGDYRAGDFTYMLADDTFAESRYVELEPAAADGSFAAAIPHRFGFSHSFEYLRAKSRAVVRWSDTAGNPFVVTAQDQNARTAYINTCTHACLSLVPARSPLRVSNEFAIAVRNVVRWLLSS